MEGDDCFMVIGFCRTLARRFRTLSVALVVIALVLSACGGETGGATQPPAVIEGQTFNLMMSTQMAPGSPIVDGFYVWAESVYERSGGRLVIDVFPSAQLGSDEDVIEQAQQGLNVAVLTDGGRMATFVPDIGIIGMAYIAENYDDVLAITQTDVFAEWTQELANDHGLRIINFNWFDGARHFLTNTPIHTPANLSGIRIRTPGAPVWATSVESMGATPVAMPWGETYNAIQTGVVDGAEAQHTASYAARLQEVVSYIIKTYHFQLVNGIVVGEDWFNSLPQDLQVILVEEAVAAASESARIIEAMADELEASMVADGMTVIEPDVEAFRQAAEAAYEALGFTELRERILSEIGR